MGERDVVFMVYEPLCLLISASCYSVCYFRVRCVQDVGLSVQKKIWARGRLYLVAWFLCTCPFLVVTTWFPANTTLTCITLSGTNLHGVFDMVVFLRQGNYWQRLAGRARWRLIPARSPDRRRFSFLVTVGGASEMS